jgi:hypothetical protein
MADVATISADLLCIPSFLGCWFLIDLNKIALGFSTIRFFAWMTCHELESWIWGLMSTGFLMQVLESIRALRCNNPQATSSHKKEAQWLFAAAGTEMLFCLTMLLKSDIRIALLCTFVAKSIGLLSVFLTPEPTFF